VTHEKKVTPALGLPRQTLFDGCLACRGKIDVGPPHDARTKANQRWMMTLSRLAML